MKKITLFLALLISSIGFSQTYDLLESFNGTGYEGAFGDTAAEYATDPSGSDQVVKITSNAGGTVWQGVNVVLTNNYKLTSDTQLTMQLDVYSTTAITIAPKAQGGVSGAPDSVTSVSHTGSGWETLTLSFDKSLDGKVPANGIYADFALHINWDTAGNSFGAPDGRVFYIKNLRGLSVTVSTAPAYDLLESFNGTGYEGAFGDTAAEYATDPSGSDQVVKITSNAGGTVWQGVNVVLTNNYKLTSDTQLTMQLDVYSTTAITIAPKAQGGVSGAPDSVTSVSHTGSGWETLTLTFDKSLDGKVPANGIYADFALHINWDTAGNTFGAADGRVFYIKNLKGLSVTVAPVVDPAPTTAPNTPPTYAAANVIGLYSEAYASVGINNVTWDDSQSEEVTIAGNKVLKVKSANFLGSTLGTPVDATAMTHFHIDYWIGTDYSVGQVFNPKLSNHANNAGETNAKDMSIEITSQEQVKIWRSADIALGTSGEFNRNNIKEFLITVANKTSVFYIDNIYMYVAGTASTVNNELLGFSMYPNPSSDRLNISAKENIQNAQIFNVIGKNVMNVNVNDTKASINISNLSSGIYLIKYNVNGKVGTAKFIKE
jgi:hypothetical protein